MNYVELINAVLFDLNETTIAETAAGLSGTRGVQTTVKKDINKAIRVGYPRMEDTRTNSTC